MEIKKKLILREIVGEIVLVPIGQSTEDFNGIITINEIGRFIWENYEKAQSEEELLQFILDEYEVDRETAKTDLDEFLDVLKKMNII